jgi:glutaminyl-peptide cyclotransferase
MILRTLRLAALLMAFSLGSAAFAAIPTYGFKVVHAYPHDRTAFTEGLFYLDGFIYESTGLEGHSQIRKESLATGKIVQAGPELPPQYFGEGIVNWRSHLIELTWRNQVGLIYDLASLKPQAQFSYSGEGWALTQNGRQIIMSDGTPDIRFLDPATLKEVRRITVTADGAPVKNINELEWVKGEILANVWMTNTIARIDPVSGKVVGWIDLTGLLSPAEISGDQDDVLNGIAYDARGDRLFVTGKRWPKLFQIRLVRRP